MERPSHHHRLSTSESIYFFCRKLIGIFNWIPLLLQLATAGVNQTMPESGEWIPVELEIVDRIWLPDTEILKLKGFNSLEVLGRLQVGIISNVLLCLMANIDDAAADTFQGLWMSISYEVLYVLATRIRFMCPMNFNRFPMDEQTCKFQVNN